MKTRIKVKIEKSFESVAEYFKHNMNMEYPELEIFGNVYEVEKTYSDAYSIDFNVGTSYYVPKTICEVIEEIEPYIIEFKKNGVNWKLILEEIKWK